MRNTLLFLLLLTGFVCDAQNINKRLRVNVDKLQFDTDNTGAWADMATQGWVVDYVGSHSTGGGVDSTATNYSAGNGLQLSNSQFAFGGALTNNTTLSGAYTLNFGTSASRIAQVNAYSTNGILLQDAAVSGTNPYLQLSAGNAMLYGRSLSLISTQNINIASGGVTSISGGGVQLAPTDSINFSLSTIAQSTDTSTDKPLLITRSGRLKQGYHTLANVSTVFGRTGTITGQAADYSAFYPSLSGSYTNPDWLVSLPVSKITFAGTSSQQILGDGSLSTKITNNNQLTNGSGYITNATGLITAGTNVVITGSGTSASPYVITSSGGVSGTTWGTISGSIGNQTDLQVALAAKVSGNSAITGATKTKVTYDSKGLVTSGADATTTDIAEGTNLYYTDTRARAATAITLTTNNTSGASSYDPVTRTLNIPNYATGSGVALTNFSAVAPLTYNNTTGAYSTSIATNKLVGRTTSGTGVMEEISVGSGLSFSAGSLSNANSFSTGLTNASNVITNNLSTGVSGGQTVVGGTLASNNLTLSSTSNATKGKIFFGANSAYDEGTSRLGIGTSTPSESLHLAGGMILGNTVATTNGTLRYTGTSVDARVGGNWLSMTNPVASQLPTTIVYNNQANNFNGNTIENYSAKYNDQTGTTYTLLASDNGKVVTFNNASTITLTVPSGLPVGFNCLVLQKGAGQVIFTTSSTTINNRQSLTKTAGQYAVASLMSISVNNFITGGDLSN
jgi:hypothetical protein